MWETPARGKKFDEIFQAVTDRYELPDGLLSRIAWQESQYNPNARGIGGLGLMQIGPITATTLRVNPFKPAQAVNGAARLLVRLYDKYDDWYLTLAAYNAGEGKVRKYGNDFERLPASIYNYAVEIMNDITD